MKNASNAKKTLLRLKAKPNRAENLYNIFFATMREPSKNNSGDKIYVKQESIKIERTTEGQTTTQEYSLKDFDTQYTSLEAANFIEFEGRKISQEGYQKLKPAQQRQATIQSTILESRPLLDQHGHLIVKHDLFNHEGLTQDGIAEAFIEFAKSEGLSFWREWCKNIKFFAMKAIT